MVASGSLKVKEGLLSQNGAVEEPLAIPEFKSQELISYWRQGGPCGEDQG